MNKQEQDLAFSAGWNYTSRHLDILLSLNSRVLPKLALLAWAPPSFLQSKHRRLTEGGHHNILVVQVNSAHCQRGVTGAHKSQHGQREQTQWHDRVICRKKAPTSEWISTYFHYRLDSTSSNETHIFSRMTPINLGYLAFCKGTL